LDAHLLIAAAAVDMAALALLVRALIGGGVTAGDAEELARRMIENPGVIPAVIDRLNTDINAALALAKAAASLGVVFSQEVLLLILDAVAAIFDGGGVVDDDRREDAKRELELIRAAIAEDDSREDSDDVARAEDDGVAAGRAAILSGQVLASVNGLEQARTALRKLPLDLGGRVGAVGNVANGAAARVDDGGIQNVDAAVAAVGVARSASGRAFALAALLAILLGRGGGRELVQATIPGGVGGAVPTDPATDASRKPTESNVRSNVEQIRKIIEEKEAREKAAADDKKKGKSDGDAAKRMQGGAASRRAAVGGQVRERGAVSRATRSRGGKTLTRSTRGRGGVKRQAAAGRHSAEEADRDGQS
jgi:hypothetical protein